MTSKSLWSRIGTTAFYGMICSFEMWQFVSSLSGSKPGRPSYWEVAVDIYFALTSWLIAGRVRMTSDRIAGALLGLLFALKVTARFVGGGERAALMGVGCAAVIAGLAAMIFGLFHTRSIRARGVKSSI